MNSNGTRSAIPLQLQKSDELDPEERERMNNFPENLSTTDRSKEFGDEDKVLL